MRASSATSKRLLSFIRDPADSDVQTSHLSFHSVFLASLHFRVGRFASKHSFQPSLEWKQLHSLQKDKSNFWCLLHSSVRNLWMGSSAESMHFSPKPALQARE